MKYLFILSIFFLFSSCSIDELFGSNDPLIGEWQFNNNDSDCGELIISKNGDLKATLNSCNDSNNGVSFVSNDDGTSTTIPEAIDLDTLITAIWQNTSDDPNFDDSTQYYEIETSDDQDIDSDPEIEYWKVEFQNDFDSANVYNRLNPDNDWRNYLTIIRVE